MDAATFWKELDSTVAFDLDQYKGTELERQAKAYFADTRSATSWDELNNMAKFSWLSFAERRAKRDS